jgi:hypothetical protein
MRNLKPLKLEVAALLVGAGTFASGSALGQEVNMWDGGWHVDATLYAWAPYIYTTVQLPPVAGGGNPTVETSPDQYLKHVLSAALLEGTVRKGDWALWTDLVYMNAQSSTTHLREIGLPGGDPTVPVSRTITAGIREAIWTVVGSFTAVRTDSGTLDVMAGIRYVSLRASISYDLTAGPVARSGGISRTDDITDGIVGVRGAVRLSADGKWFMPYEADIGAGSNNWVWNAMLGAGYHFHWGDLTLGGRNLSYQRSGSGNELLQKIRMTGPMLAGTWRW